jgi:hypothetical protein|tara:strand:+ start:286 stop:516 length:231 start_codon:yes stop_codon:yes gene_type:complete
MNLESFDIDQRIKVRGKSSKGKNRIIEHGNMWRVKNKFKKGHFPWVEEDSVLLESLRDRVTSRWMKIIEDTDFELV